MWKERERATETTDRSFLSNQLRANRMNFHESLESNMLLLSIESAYTLDELFLCLSQSEEGGGGFGRGEDLGDE